MGRPHLTGFVDGHRHAMTWAAWAATLQIDFNEWRGVQVVWN